MNEMCWLWVLTRLWTAAAFCRTAYLPQKYDKEGV